MMLHRIIKPIIDCVIWLLMEGELRFRGRARPLMLLIAAKINVREMGTKMVVVLNFPSPRVPP